MKGHTSGGNADSHRKQYSLTHWGTATVVEKAFYGVEAVGSYLMISILTSLVNLIWVGLLTARAGWQSMTSSPLVCAPYECVRSQGLMSWALNHRWSLAAAGSGCEWPGPAAMEASAEMKICFIIQPKFGKEQTMLCLVWTSVWCSCFNWSMSVFLL